MFGYSTSSLFLRYAVLSYHSFQLLGGSDSPDRGSVYSKRGQLRRKQQQQQQNIDKKNGASFENRHTLGLSPAAGFGRKVWGRFDILVHACECPNSIAGWEEERFITGACYQRCLRCCPSSEHFLPRFEPGGRQIVRVSSPRLQQAGSEWTFTGYRDCGHDGSFALFRGLRIRWWERWPTCNTFFFPFSESSLP